MREAIDTLFKLEDIQIGARICRIRGDTMDESRFIEFRSLVQRLSTEFSAAIQEGATGEDIRGMANSYTGLKRDLRTDSELSRSFQRLYEGFKEYDMEIGYPLEQFEQLCRAYFTIEEKGGELFTLPPFDWYNTRFTYLDDRWSVVSD